MKFYTPFNRSPRTQFVQKNKISRTKQSEHDSTDINKIMERFNRTGQLPHINPRTPSYGESVSIEYDQALILIREAKERFMQLPAKTRFFFENDPAKLEAFLADPNNDQKAVELGFKTVRPDSPTDLLKEVVKNTKKEDSSEPKK